MSFPKDRLRSEVSVQDLRDEKCCRPDKEVLRIDYSSSDNPWWCVRVVDEIVEVKPGEYLGKVCLRPFPQVSVALAFFRLSK